LTNGKLSTRKRRNQIFAVLMVFVLLLLVSASQMGASEPSDGLQPTKWSVSVPSDLCPGGTHYDCHGGSPVLADINGDGYLDAVVVTNKGFIVAIRHDGVKLWQKDIAPAFGMAPGTHEINSSPAVADIDNDGFPEIAVGAGTIWHNSCTQGGVIVLDHNGNVEPGWPKLGHDVNIPPVNCADTIISSPSLGDLDNDGDMEVVASGFDKRIYAWHHDGTLLPGFPPDSFHRTRFPTWPNLQGFLADDIWSSPSLADIDGDGFLDIVTGTGEGNFDQRYGGNANGWACPYASPPADGSPGYCGGAIYAVNRYGDLLPGFPRYFLEAIVSSLAMADVNDDGAYEIFTGFSNYYYTVSPDHPTYGFRLVGLDSQANDLPGWQGGKAMGGVSMMSPAIGDIAGDDGLEIVTLGGDRKLYAWHVNGTPVAGFPMTPLDTQGNPSTNFNNYSGLVLADFDGDPKMEIFFSQSWAVTVVDGTGHQLTGSNYPTSSEPIYSGNGLLINTPALGDIDNDGKLELVATNSTARAWDLDNTTDNADWPVFRGDAMHRGRISRDAFVSASPGQLIIHRDEEESGPIRGTIAVYPPQGGPVTWTVSAAEGLSASPTSGMAYPGEPAYVVISITDTGFSRGMNSVGEVNFVAHAYGEESDPAFASVPVTVYVGDFSLIFMPSISK
jgi:hypothetical protein